MNTSDRRALAERQSKLSPAKRELLARLKRGESAPEAGPSSIPRRPVAASAPLSFAQERLWFLHRLEPGSTAYNLPSLVRLRGRLDGPALRWAFAQVVRRHEILRTRFTASDQGPVQVVLPRVEVSLPAVDLRGCREGEPEARRCLRRAVREPFDLGRPPLVRTLLLRLGDEEHLLLLNLHHIVSDGWSDGILIREVASLYRAFRRGGTSPLPPLPIQYADFAVWQRRTYGELRARQLAYWRRQLAGVPPLLELPTDRPRPAVQGQRGAHCPVPVGAALAVALRQLCQEHKTTPFMTLLATFQVLLARYTGQHDLALGSPVAHRGRSELESLIGFFVNTVVLRVDLGGNPGFPTLLERVREVTLGAYAHQDVPFDALVEELSPERDLSHSPLFQVMFVFQNAPFETLELPGLSLELQELDDGTSKFDLMLVLTERGEQLGGYLEYNCDLFDRTTIKRLAGHFRSLLEAIVATPGRRLADFPLLRPPERQQLLREWNDSGAPPAMGACLHQRFEQQAERTPEVPAVVLDDQRLSYQELNRQANRLAHHLRSLGVGGPANRPETAVGICIERSPAMVMAILAVLKAGGFYVPLDPAYPRERLRLMVEDSRIALLLTRRQLAAELAELPLRTLCLDEGPSPGPGGEDNSTPGPALHNLAYVLYTSGSTGRPKGVGCHHLGVLNLLADFTSRAPIAPGDACSWWTSPSFDVSVYEIFSALLAGGSLQVVPERVHADGERFVAWLREERIRSAYVAPSMLPELAAHSRELGLRRLLVGVEPIPEPVLATIRQGIPGLRIINGYGPTEATICCTLYNVGKTAEPRNVPIGRPVRNSAVHLLDRQLRPAPIGVPGELHVSGCGLARGYHRQPGRTAERFIPDPFGGEPGGRLYRTGDLVRTLPDGDLMFLGRRDRQVKVRGFRIELGEVVAALERHPEVQETVVLAREFPVQLVAYVATRAAALSAGELRRFLRRTLPDFMVPSAYVFLDKLPLTPNGKLDWRALPAPAADHGPLPEEPTAPRNPTEEMLAAIWSEVLEVERVGVHESFFDLGGHSLLATQVLSRVRKTFQVELPLKRLFEAPTVAELGRELAAAAGSPQEAPPPLVPVPRSGDLALSFAQQRLWVLDQLAPGEPAYNIPAAVRLRGELDRPALAASLSALVRRHEALRTRFVQVRGQARQVIDPPSPLPLPVVDLAALAPERGQREAHRLAVDEGRRSFELSRGPLMRAALLGLGADHAVLLLNVHHIVSDGWSTGVLIRELAALYEAGRRRRPSPLPALGIQYADFAHWQRQWLQGEVLERQLAYWRGRLAALPAPLTLPADRPRPGVWSAGGAVCRFRLPATLSSRLRSLSREQGATLYMTLLAALQALLVRTTGERDFCIGSPIANRGDREIEGLIGFFVNTLVMRAEVAGDPSFCQLLEQVRRTALDAYAHQDLPFELLVEALDPQRDLSRAPLYQLFFVLQNAPLPPLELPDLTLELLEIHNHTTKFDVSMILTAGAEGVEGWIEYSTELFDATTIRRLVAHYRNLLAGIVDDGERPLSALPLHTAAERHQLLWEWNATARTYPREALVHALVAAQAERAPAAAAVVAGREQLSYGELEARSSSLARELQCLGVGPESRVAVVMPGSPELVVALLAVLKAGGAYVALDPAYPPQRLSFMAADAEAAVALTREELVPRLAELAGRGVRVLTSGEIASGEGSPPAARSGPGNLAYVIYTSGSTGVPKGVAVTHRSLMNLVSWHRQLYRVGPGERTTQIASPGFDASVWEIWPALAAGATLCIPDPKTRSSPAELVAWLAAEAVTVSFLPTPLAELALGQEWPSHAPLRALLTGGEKLRQRPRPGLRFALMNHYGPTENTVVATCGAVAPGPGGETPSIGRPIANVGVYLLDRRLQPVPLGAAGELCLGGASLTRGYLGRPARSAELFVPDPFAGPGERLYRTGDLTRFRPDGRIEFLGRIDHQVKVRGFRIEPAEIEAVLDEHPGVDQAVVLARDDLPGGRALVAWVVPVTDPAPPDRAPLTAGVAFDQELTVGALRRHLSERLPDYMVPAAFVFLPALPLLPNGKVDRRSLPGPDAGRPQLEQALVPPSTPHERLLAEIWSQLLRRDQIGIDDSFFELGGDSILGIQMVARAREAGLRLTPRDVYQYQTIAELAAVAGTAPTAAVRHPVAGPVPLTPIQHWLFARELPEVHHFNQAVLLELRRPPQLPLLDRALATVLVHHDALRLRFDRHRGQWRQRHAGGEGRVPLTCVDLSALAEPQPATTAAAAVLHASLDLGRGPLARLALFELGPERPARLLWVIHHLVVDGVSWRVLLADLEQVYGQLERGEKASPGARTESFQSWSERLQEHAGGEEAEQESAYWLEALSAPPPPLPVDHAGGVNTMASARTVSVELTEEETRNLLREVPAAYNTRINEVLLTALAQTFRQWTGEPRLLVDLEGHGREELFAGVDLSRTVGWFTLIYPVLLDLGPAPDPGAELVAVKEHLRAVPRGGIGYGLLRYLSPRPQLRQQLASLPAAEVSFNYLGQLDPVLADSTLLRPLREGSGPATGGRGLRSHLLEITGGVFAERLRLNWTYSENLHRRRAIETLAAGHQQALRQLVDHCLSPTAGAYTPTDFPGAKLGQQDLNRLFAQIQRGNRS